MKVKSEREVAQLCPTLSDPIDCSLPGSYIHGILQERVLEWDTIAFSGQLILNMIGTFTLVYSWAKSSNTKPILMKVKEESEKVGLKLNIQKSKIMASGPITSQQIYGEIMETVRDFIFGGSKITADGDCSHEIKRCLLLGRKVMTNLDSILKSRDITLPTKVSQSYGFSSSHVWIWELDYKESWAPKNWCF